MQRGVRRRCPFARWWCVYRSVPLACPPRPARPRPPPTAPPPGGRAMQTHVDYTALPFRTYNFARRKFQPKQFNGLFENSKRVRVS